MARRSQRYEQEASAFAALTFAVYARKSTDDARHEDHRSTTRQVEQAARYVEARGGAVLPEHIYVDEGISGAEFKNRPGLARLMNAIENGRPFGAVVMSDGDRLGREQYQTGYLLKQIADSGCRLFFYLEDREAVLDDATNKLLESIRNFGREFEREKAQQRARDAAERKARQGHVTGGDCFGYVNVRMKGDREAGPGEAHDYVTRRIREDQAEAIRGMFRMYAAGYGMVAVAKAMNGVPRYADQLREFFGGTPPPPPRPTRHGQASWSPAAVREMLYRPLYRGEIVWGRTTKTDRDGRAGVTVQAEREPLRIPAPALRIVPEDVCRAVDARLRAARDDYLRDTRGKLWGRPDRGREGGYLLTGLAICAECGWNIAVLGGKLRVYGCWHRRGRGTCANNVTRPVETVDAAFLAALEREVLTPQQFRYAVECAVEEVKRQLVEEPDRRGALEREKASWARKVERLVAAIADGKGPAALVREIERTEARVKEIEAELARLAAAPALTAADVGRLEGQVNAELRRFSELLKGNVPMVRQVLKKLLVGPVTFTPVERGNGKRTYAFKAELSYGAILESSLAGVYNRVVAPTGIEPVFRP